jgi:hypothetical protein
VSKRKSISNAEAVLQVLRRRMITDRDQLKVFADKLLATDHPEDVLDYSQNVFNVAASIGVSAHMIGAIEKHGDVLTAAHSARDEALRHARSPQHSTSPVSNYMHITMCAEWAAFASEFGQED